MSARYAMITPYCKEDEGLLRRCIDSVRNQSVRCDHLLIADGFPQAWIDRRPVRHIKLDRAHGDAGNAARGIGALLAIAEEYDGIGFIDADNWLDVNHIEACLEAASTCEGGASHCDYVIAQRRFRRPDETVMPIPEEIGHVDTNCFFFLRGAFSVVPRWATMPKAMALVGDRVFLMMLRQQPFRHVRAEKITVNYHCIWESCYWQLGERPPERAKPNVDANKVGAWLRSLPTRELEIVYRLVGVAVIGAPRPEERDAGKEGAGPGSRNAPCACGSGKRFKRCHGALTSRVG